MRLGIASIIRNLFPDAVLLHAASRPECLRILANEEVNLIISDGTIDKGPDMGMIRKVRALQPDTKIIMLLEGTKTDHFKSICLAGTIDIFVTKNAPVERIREAILHALSGIVA